MTATKDENPTSPPTIAPIGTEDAVVAVSAGETPDKESGVVAFTAEVEINAENPTALPKILPTGTFEDAIGSVSVGAIGAVSAGETPGRGIGVVTFTVEISNVTGPVTGIVTFTTDCTTRVPLGSPFLIKLLLSTLWSLIFVGCPIAVTTEVCTWTEVAKSNLAEAILEVRVETSSMLRIFTFSIFTPADVATLATYLSFLATNNAMVIGKVTIMTMA
jgi:hypothetical protein